MLKSLWWYWCSRFWEWWGEPYRGKRRRVSVHRITDIAGWHGGYICTCGAPWLIEANRCMTQ